MNESRASLPPEALLNKVEQCLVVLKRQRKQVAAFNASMFGILASALLIAVYIVVWPSASEKLTSLTVLSLDELWSWPFTVLLPTAVLWVILSLALFALSFIYFSWRNSRVNANSSSAINSQTFLLHLNRQHAALEESAHLLSTSSNSLSVIQTLQLQRITPALTRVIDSPLRSWLPKASFSTLGWKNVGAFLFSLLLLTFAVLFTNSDKLSDSSTKALPSSIDQVVLNYLDRIIVSVKPPLYTKQAPFEQRHLDLSVLQGSEIMWLIPIEQNEHLSESFELSVSSSDVRAFVRTKFGYSATLTADQGMVYSIAQLSDKADFNTDIATVIVERDTPPKIIFQAPTLTITEIPKNVFTSIQAEVEISDDYGISDVKIIASIAKGSGEAVKFRDQEFLFDLTQGDETSALYIKNWDLQALGMSPGDELYFSVQATDNKMPNMQQTVSPIRIIRWLEDEEARVTGEGVVIDFIPEYFKSQRQIIIETEALIEQSQTLSSKEFSAVSRALAIDQSDLKQSYGQYLGDELESGVMQNMEAGPSLPAEAGHTDEHHDNEHDLGKNVDAQNLQQSHEHESEVPHSQGSNDISGYQQAIEQFGHNHGETDIGFIKTSSGQINPKVLMKRAIGVMWQAELHLQMSEPALALPFEKEALNYVNRAKQAERIYVERLGFEPPPVTEERRYTGELKDILSYERDTELALAPDKNSQFIALIVLINDYLTLQRRASNTAKKLTSSERLLLDDIALHLTEQLAGEPAWITQLATLKRIQLANSLEIQDCLNCLQSLISELSSRIKSPVAQPYRELTPYSANHPSVKAYSKSLIQNDRAPTGGNTQVQQEDEL